MRVEERICKHLQDDDSKTYYVLVLDSGQELQMPENQYPGNEKALEIFNSIIFKNLKVI